jgi:nucleotide-binding universal stress UspA family protein
MNIKDILLLVDGETRAAGPYAQSLASRVGAHLTAAAFILRRPLAGPYFSELPHSLVEGMYEDHRRAAEQAVSRFEGITHPPGIETRIVTVPAGESTEGHFRWFARHFDLTVVEQPDDAVGSGSMVEAALFGSGRPILLVPNNHTAPAQLGTVLIAWDESATAARAVADALPLIEMADRVELVTVAEPRSDGPSATRMVDHLRHHGIEVRAVELPAGGRIAEVLLAHAADQSADLLVMGGYGHSRLREFILGGTTRTMLASMTVPTLMAH